MNPIAQQILDFNDRKPVITEEWGLKIQVKPMSGVDRDSYDLERWRARQEGNEPSSWRAPYLVRCLFDMDDNRIFTNDQADALAGKNAETLKRLFELASGINTTGADAVTDAAKN